MITSPPDPGPGVDAQGLPVLDPTANVLSLVEAAVKRLDDLRELEASHQWEMQRTVASHLRAMANLRGEFGEKLRNAESARIDAIRAVDIGAVQRAAEVSATQAQTLANQVVTSAETLRTQVAASAAAAATALAAALDPIQKDIADLRRAQYEQAGQKAQVVESRGSSGATITAIGPGLTLMIVLMALISVLSGR